jgi:chromosome partitioning protein
MTVIAVFNPKPGVGKTTTALNLLAGIARRGARPMGIDLDPQAHLSNVFDASPRLAEDSMHAFFVGQRPLADVAQITASGVILCPAHPDLAGLDAHLGRGANVVTRLRFALRRDGAAPGPVVIDCCALMGVLALNAIFACDLLLVPVVADYLGIEGAQQAERSLRALEPVFKRRLPRRYVLTRFDPNGRMSDEVADLMAIAFPPEEICATRITEDPGLAGVPTLSKDLLRHAPRGGDATDYEALLGELVGAGLVA